MKSEFKAAVKQVNIAASDSRRAWLEISSRASRISSNCLSAFNKNRTQADRGADRALIRASERARVSADIFFGCVKQLYHKPPRFSIDQNWQSNQCVREASIPIP